MVIDYNSVKIEFPKHGNRLQHVIIDYISVSMKPVSQGNRLQLRDNRLHKYETCSF